MTYAEKLRDPRWQRMRLLIMARDGFACRHCGDTRTTLNVHHKFYEKGAAPWEYEATCLLTLCRPCHARLEERIKEMAQALAEGAQFGGTLLNFARLLRWSRSGHDAGNGATIVLETLWDSLSDACRVFARFMDCVVRMQQQGIAPGDWPEFINARSLVLREMERVRAVLEGRDATRS